MSLCDWVAFLGTNTLAVAPLVLSFVIGRSKLWAYADLLDGSLWLCTKTYGNRCDPPGNEGAAENTIWLSPTAPPRGQHDPSRNPGLNVTSYDAIVLHPRGL